MQAQGGPSRAELWDQGKKGGGDDGALQMWRFETRWEEGGREGGKEAVVFRVFPERRRSHSDKGGRGCVQTGAPPPPLTMWARADQ